MSHAHHSRDRDDQDLFTHLQKACNLKETAPKQKHVRCMCLAS